MSDTPKERAREEQGRPPRFGRDVARPRAVHARAVIAAGADVLADIDRLITPPVGPSGPRRWRSGTERIARA